ncbi:hypothetical protein AFCDBAGC_3960 [Methylobacterium cerastii]|uniref:Methyltransferase type 11 domain-containing protein n=1 Tax=Methylobacterium cerastii TaxID=932741 RepID=A0ABQ4QLF2_9HYPH|nr:methyltransferase domain-containing protein [Methylobacterium cerastii]GJD46080.1 hypothetical protein AFCDBAGC_3960 [Methylobacterium cerastii]
MVNLFNLLPTMIRPGDIPLELDLNFYRLVNDDLTELNNEALTAHYHAYGREEGRLASPAAHRRGFTALVDSKADILEIGPFTKPTIRGPKVQYFDVMNRSSLLERALLHNHPTKDCPEIHFVSPIGDLGVVNKNFDIVLSSHCVEHQPDLVNHLRNVERILRPGGRYLLLIPDKRYCFDALLPESSLAEIIEAHRERRRTHTWPKVHEHRALTTHNDSARHWAGDSSDPHAHLRQDREQAARKEYEDSQGNYIDVHAWQFTPESFRSIIKDLQAARLTNLSVERVYHTPHGSNEFGAIIRKSI